MIIRTYETLWEVELTSGKKIKENQLSFDFLRGSRRIDWALDIISTGDIHNIKMLYLHTPRGLQWIEIREKDTAFQFKRGTQMFFQVGDNVANAHIIGRIEDKETGNCSAIVYDYFTKETYFLGTNIFNFGSWREGVAPVGPMNLDVLGIKL